MDSDVGRSKKLRWLDDPCNACGGRLNSWDARISKALRYRYAVCEACIGKEYDKTPEEIRAYFEEVFHMRPCMGL